MSSDVATRPSVADETVIVGSPEPPALSVASAPVAPNVVTERAPLSVETTVIAPGEPATKVDVVIEFGEVLDGSAIDSDSWPAEGACPFS